MVNDIKLQSWWDDAEDCAKLKYKNTIFSVPVKQNLKDLDSVDVRSFYLKPYNNDYLQDKYWALRKDRRAYLSMSNCFKIHFFQSAKYHVEYLREVLPTIFNHFTISSNYDLICIFEHSFVSFKNDEDAAKANLYLVI